MNSSIASTGWTVRVVDVTPPKQNLKYPVHLSQSKLVINCLECHDVPRGGTPVVHTRNAIALHSMCGCYRRYRPIISILGHRPQTSLANRVMTNSCSIFVKPHDTTALEQDLESNLMLFSVHCFLVSNPPYPLPCFLMC